MQLLFILGASSFVIALILTPMCRDVFRRLGVVDHLDQHRKLHPSPVPNMGGVPLVIAYLASFGVAVMIAQRVQLGNINFSLAVRLVPAIAVIFLAGLLDDRFGLQPIQKIIAQVFAGLLTFWAGVHITGVAGHMISPWLSFLLTIGWLMLCTNSFNLIDGVDGLATGVGLFATATTLIAALLQHNVALAIATVPLAGALLGFLRYNFNPATIFLGDSGSLLIGFLLGCFGVIWSQKSATILGMTAPLIALSIPILDLCLSIVRRFLRHQSILRGDRGHIHHRLLARGFSARKVVLLLYASCGIAAVLSLLQSVAANHYATAVILVFCGVAWIGIQNLGYTEFDQARRLLLAGGFRRSLNSQLALRAFQQSLTEAATTEERWEVLQKALQKFDLVEARWRTDGKLYHAELWQASQSGSWTLRIPLADGDYINFTRVANMDDPSFNVGAFVKVIREVLAQPPQQPSAAAGVMHAVRKPVHSALAGGLEGYIEPSVSSQS